MKYLLAVWSQNPEHYFFIENIINLFKNKFDTTLICQKKKNSKKNKKFKGYKKHEIYSSKFNLINNLLFIYFIFYLAILIIIKKPNKVIIFNYYPILSILFFRIFYSGDIIYHNFDYNPYNKSLLHKFLTYIERKLSKHFKILIFSNKKRGNLFRKLSQLNNLKIFTAFNSVPLNFIKKTNKIKNSSKKILFRLGSIGPGHSLLNLVKSMKYLDDDFKLHLCGNIVDKNYFKQLKDFIYINNLEKKIKIKISASDFYWKKKMAVSKIGIALYEKANTSHKYMVGASQKINAYLSAGLPILVSNDKQYLDFNKKYKCCINVDINDPYNIADSIKKVIFNKKKYTKLKYNSFNAFQNEFNFEKQVDKIINYI